MALRTKTIDVEGDQVTIRQLGLGEITDIMVAEKAAGEDAAAMFTLICSAVKRSTGKTMEEIDKIVSGGAGKIVYQSICAFTMEDVPKDSSGKAPSP